MNQFPIREDIKVLSKKKKKIHGIKMILFHKKNFFKIN